MKELMGQFVIGFIYEQTKGSAGVLCLWEEEAGTLVKPQHSDVPDFCCLLFGLLGWTTSHTCHPVYA